MLIFSTNFMDYNYFIILLLLQSCEGEGQLIDLPTPDNDGKEGSNAVRSKDLQGYLKRITSVGMIKSKYGCMFSSTSVSLDNVMGLGCLVSSETTCDGSWLAWEELSYFYS